jgi:hypothetical protein
MQANKQANRHNTGHGNSFSLNQHHNESPRHFTYMTPESKSRRHEQNGSTWQMRKTTSICTFAVHPSLPSEGKHKDIIT